MRVSSHRLADALAIRMAGVVPAGYSVLASGDGVNVFSGSRHVGGSPAASIVEDDDGDPVEARAARAAVAVLGGIQDDLCADMGVQWPVDRNGELAWPATRSDGGKLHLWFGRNEAEAVILLQPIELRQLGEG